jgi:tetratricopeptide (TPR) repeat protein
MAPAVVRRGEFELTFKVVDVKSGLILAQKTERQTSEKKKINHPQAAQTQLPNQGDIEQRLIDAALNKVCRHVAPYETEEKVRWDGNCKMDECEEALRYIELGMLDEAGKALEQRLAKTLAATRKREERKGKDVRLASIYYNMGLVAELQGEMEKALEMYTQALKARIKDPAEKQRQAHERVEQCIGAWEAYHSQAAQ